MGGKAVAMFFIFLLKCGRNKHNINPILRLISSLKWRSDPPFFPFVSFASMYFLCGRVLEGHFIGFLLNKANMQVAVDTGQRLGGLSIGK